jgi:DNA-binding MarR family transcriptional regulator
VRSRTDRRRAELHLTAKGEAAIERLSTTHLRELRQIGPDLLRLISSITDA